MATRAGRAAAALAVALQLLPRHAASEPVVAIAGGYSHSLFLKESGNVYGSGHNLYGELMTDVAKKRTQPVHMVKGAVAIAAGYYHSLVLLEDKRVLSAGDNQDGQLGIGGDGDAVEPVEVMKEVQAIAAGGSHSLFFTTAQNVYAAGYNAFGQLGDGTLHDHRHPVQVRGLEGFRIKGMAAGTFHSLFLTMHGTVLGAGSDENGQLGTGSGAEQNPNLRRVELPGRAKDIAAGAFHSLFLMDDGTVYSTGQNKGGQLGDGTNKDRLTPVKVVHLDNVSRVAGGFQHSAFLDSTGHAWTVGANDHGQLADGTNKARNYPVRINTPLQIRRVAAGALHTIFLMQDGTVATAGSNFWGQLGDGSGEDQPTPVNALVPWELNKDEEYWLNDAEDLFETAGRLRGVGRLAAGPAAFVCAGAVALCLAAGSWRRGLLRGVRAPPLASEEGVAALVSEH